MKKLLVFTCALLLIAAGSSNAQYTILFSDGFETAWTGDYAPGWENSGYRHGEPPVGKMMQQTSIAYSGSYGLKLIADSVPQSWMWWAAVNPQSLPHHALDKQYNPYISAWYYDELGDTRAGQLFAVPDWVNPYLKGGEDWTDVQFGGRPWAEEDYYYVAVGQNHPGWQNTGVARTAGWHNLKFQLSAIDGRIHFYIDGNLVGSSYRNDYTNLGATMGLYTMFDDPLSGWGDNKPYTIWDDFEVGSTIPEPGTFLLLGFGLLGLAGLSRKKLFKK